MINTPIIIDSKNNSIQVILDKDWNLEKEWILTISRQLAGYYSGLMTPVKSFRCVWRAFCAFSYWLRSRPRADRCRSACRLLKSHRLDRWLGLPFSILPCFRSALSGRTDWARGAGSVRRVDRSETLSRLARRRGTCMGFLVPLHCRSALTIDYFATRQVMMISVFIE